MADRDPRRYDPSVPVNMNAESFKQIFHVSFSHHPDDGTNSGESSVDMPGEWHSEKLTTQFVLYIDELGTTDSSRADYSDSQLQLDLMGYRSIRRYMDEQNQEWQTPVTVKTFSDNIIVAAPTDGPNGPAPASAVLSRFISVASRIQIEGCMNSRFYRGAIAKGPLYIDNDL
jgi:hypothetical protein